MADAISKQCNSIMKAHQDHFKPTWYQYYISYYAPISTAIELLYKGSGALIKYLVSQPRDIFSPRAWQRELAAATMPEFMRQVDASMADLKTDLVAMAKGTVLEIGAGTGETLKYFRMERVEKIFGVEPSLKKCARIKEETKRLGIEAKYEVVPFGIETTEELEKLGIVAGSIDTIVAVNALPLTYPVILSFLRALV